MKSFSSLFGLLAILLLSATSSAQTVCPNCGQIHQASFVSSVDATSLIPTVSNLPVASSFTSNQGYNVAAPYASNVSFNATSPVSFQSGNTVDAQTLAQQRAEQAASTMNRGHLGGSLGPATHEGVGYSSSSSQQAIDAACYSGSPISAQGPGRPRLGTGVARGSDGWYSCLLCL